MIKKSLAMLMVIAIIISLIPNVTFAQDKNSDKHRTGLTAPTERELKLFNEKAKEVKTVLPNAEGLKRINEERVKKGLEPLSAGYAAAKGDEIINTKNSSRKEKKYSSILNVYGEINESLPAAVDLSLSEHFPAIGDQGWIGSCASFATTYYAATYETAALRNIDLSAYPGRILSPKFNYNLNNDGEDGGSDIEGNLLTLYTRGAPFIDETSMQQYQYNGYDFISGTTIDPLQYREYPQTAGIYNDALKNRIYDFGYLTGCNTADGLNEIKNMINNGHVLMFGTDYMYDWKTDKLVGDDPSTTADDTYAGQIACYGMVIQNVNIGSGHALTVVGYDDDIWVDIDGDTEVDTFEKGALEIANSWGEGWGNGGFIWLSYNALQDANGHSGVVSDNTFYYIVAQAEYTPVATAEITINTAMRNELWLYAGVNWSEAAEPINWYSDYVFSGSRGGPYSFAGTTTASTATVVIDLSDAITEEGFGTANGVLSLCAEVEDDYSDPYSQQVSSVVFKANGSSSALGTFPVSVNGDLKPFCGKRSPNGGNPPAYHEAIEGLPVITLNTVVTATSSGPEDEKEYTFVPSVSGLYTFKDNTGSSDIGLTVYNSARSPLYTGYGGFMAPLYQGKTYVIGSWHEGNNASSALNTKIMIYSSYPLSGASANLSGITVSTGEALSPSFDASTYSYSAHISGDTTISVTPTDPDAYVLNGGDESTSKNYILDNDSAKNARIEVTSKDWLQTNVYNIILTKGSPSADASLKNITSSAGTLTPVFNANTYEYTLSITNASGVSTISPAKTSIYATMSINGTNISYITLSLATGQSKDVVIQVTAQDGVTVKTYTIHASRPPSSNANLSYIGLSNGTLTPSFNANTAEYSVTLASNIPGVTVTPTKADSTSTMKIDGIAASNEAVTLDPGQSKDVVIEVTAQDGTTKKTYTIHITRALYSCSIITASNNTNFGTVSGGGTCMGGIPVTLRATPKAGCRFVRWTEGGIEISANAEYTFTPLTNRLFTAEFAVIGPPAISSVSCPAYNNVKLTWSEVGGAAGYELYRATSSTGTYTKIPVDITETSYTDTVPQWGKTYYYKVKAYCVTSTGVKTYGKLSAYKYARPNWVTPGLKAVSPNYHSISLSWDTVPGADYYIVYRNTYSTGTYKVIAEKVYTLYYIDEMTADMINRTFYYKVRPVDAEGGSQGIGPWSAYRYAKASWQTLNLTAKTFTYHSIKLTWNPVDYADYYYVWRSTYNGGYARVVDAGLNPIKVYTTEYTDEGRAKGKIYYYKVQPIDEGRPAPVGVGPLSAYKYAKADWPAIKLTAVSDSYNSIKLTWNKIDEADGYEIYRSTSYYGFGNTPACTVPQGGGAEISYTDHNGTEGLVPGKTYYYKIKAYTGTEKSPFSSCKYAKPVPSAPVTVYAVRTSATSINVSWNAVEGASGYEVRRAASLNGTYYFVTNTTADQLSFDNTGLYPNKVYYYKVRAYCRPAAANIYGPYSEKKCPQ